MDGAVSDAEIEHPVVVLELKPRDTAALHRAIQHLVPETSIRDLLYLSAPDAAGHQLCRLTCVLDAEGVFVNHTVTRTTPEGPLLEEPETATGEFPASAIVRTLTDADDAADFGDIDDDDDGPDLTALVPLDTLPDDVIRALHRLRTLAFRRTHAELNEAEEALETESTLVGVPFEPDAPDSDLPVDPESFVPTPGGPTGIEVAMDRGGRGRISFFFEPNVPPEESGAEHHLWHNAPELDELKESLHPDTWWEHTVEEVSTWVRKVFGR